LTLELELEIECFAGSATLSLVISTDNILFEELFIVLPLFKLVLPVVSSAFTTPTQRNKNIIIKNINLILINLFKEIKTPP
jgi:hypothetical protein